MTARLHVRQDPRIRVRVARVQNQGVLLRHAVDAQGLVIQVRVVPVIEQTVAAAHRRLVALGCPREAEPRHQVHLVRNQGLGLVADADAVREPVVHPDVVLPVDADLVVVEVGLHLPDADAIRRWQSGLERVETAKVYVPFALLWSK